jgi:hypothetical protein
VGAIGTKGSPQKEIDAQKQPQIPDRFQNITFAIAIQ